MSEQLNQYYHRWASSLGALEDTPENIWGTLPYDPSVHQGKDVVFCGLYGLPDFYTLWRHKGKKFCWWTGSDIRHLLNGYWLDTVGTIRLPAKTLAKWIAKNCESWVENEVEGKALEQVGIKSNVCPSFLGKAQNFNVTYQCDERPQLYTSVSGDDFDLYGWYELADIAEANPDIDFYCYGNTKEFPRILPNLKIRGRVPKEVMNAEIKTMQGAIRLVELEGFSEIVCKSLLMGQWPVSSIPYPNTISVEGIRTIFDKKEPNVEGREWCLNSLNKYPWVNNR